MFSRFIASFVPALLVFTALTAASPQTFSGDPASSGCSAGKVEHCCDSTHDPQLATRSLDELPQTLNLSNLLGKVGLGCTPTANLETTCKSQPVCCDQPASNTPVNIQTGCTTL